MPQPTLQRDEVHRVMDDLPDAPDMLLPLLDWLATYLRRTAWITDSADYAKWSKVIEHETRLRWIEERLGVVQERPPDGLPDLRARTASGTLAIARERGRTLSLEAAIDEALGDRSEGPPDRQTQPATRLTRRELEIARLVAQGLSNLQIAQRLAITEGTTQNHVSHILDKLGLTSRTQVAGWFLSQYEQQRHPAGASQPGEG